MIVSFGKSMELDMGQCDLNQLVKQHSKEMTREDLKEIKTQQHTEVLQETGVAEQVISSREIKSMCYLMTFA